MATAQTLTASLSPPLITLDNLDALHPGDVVTFSAGMVKTGRTFKLRRHVGTVALIGNASVVLQSACDGMSYALVPTAISQVRLVATVD